MGNKGEPRSRGINRSRLAPVLVQLWPGCVALSNKLIQTLARQSLAGGLPLSFARSHSLRRAPPGRPRDLYARRQKDRQTKGEAAASWPTPQLARVGHQQEQISHPDKCKAQILKPFFFTARVNESLLERTSAMINDDHCARRARLHHQAGAMIITFGRRAQRAPKHG